MNINSYSNYSNSLLNTYNPVSNNQAVDVAQNNQSLNQNSSNQTPIQSTPNTVNDFNINISQEARQISSDTSQALNSTSTLTSSNSTTYDQDAVATLTQQVQQSQQLQQAEEQNRQAQQYQQVQQEQQTQSLFYQSPYGQVPISRTSIDLMV